MILTLIVECSNELDKLQRPIGRLRHDRDDPLPTTSGKYHKENDTQQRKIKSPSQWWALDELPEWRLLRHKHGIGLDIRLRSIHRQIRQIRHQSEYIDRCVAFQHSIVGEKQWRRDKNDLTLAVRNRHRHRYFLDGESIDSLYPFFLSTIVSKRVKSPTYKESCL